MDKYRLEEWLSITSQLHSCIGLGREEKSHPNCRVILRIIVNDITEVLEKETW
jgi:hypothetical protein